MPFHFCIDELIMIMTMIPIIGIFFRKVHAWWHTKFNHKSHPQKDCFCDDYPHDRYLTKEDMDAKRKKYAKRL